MELQEPLRTTTEKLEGTLTKLGYKIVPDRIHSLLETLTSEDLSYRQLCAVDNLLFYIHAVIQQESRIR